VTALTSYRSIFRGLYRQSVDRLLAERHPQLSALPKTLALRSKGGQLQRSPARKFRRIHQLKTFRVRFTIPSLELFLQYPASPSWLPTAVRASRRNSMGFRRASVSGSVLSTLALLLKRHGGGELSHASPIADTGNHVGERKRCMATSCEVDRACTIASPSSPRNAAVALAG
jgi:hypothetical protein